MSTTRLRWIGPAMITMLLSGPAFAAAGLPQDGSKSAATVPAERSPLTTQVAKTAQPAVTTPAAASAPVDESARYAEREQQDKSLEQFKGGEGLSIYMGGSVLAIALLLVVLLVLL